MLLPGNTVPSRNYKNKNRYMPTPNQKRVINKPDRGRFRTKNTIISQTELKPKQTLKTILHTSNLTAG